MQVPSSSRCRSSSEIITCSVCHVCMNYAAASNHLRMSALAQSMAHEAFEKHLQCIWSDHGDKQ